MTEADLQALAEVSIYNHNRDTRWYAKQLLWREMVTTGNPVAKQWWCWQRELRPRYSLWVKQQVSNSLTGNKLNGNSE